MASEYRLRVLKEHQLIKLAKAGDKKALSMIILRYEAMVKRIASKYYAPGGDQNDIIQIGYVGLIQAVFNYDESKKTKFSSFAYTNIESEIKSFITALNRKKNKVLSEAVSLESMYPESSEDSGYYIFEMLSRFDLERSVLVDYFYERATENLSEKEKEMVMMWLEKYPYKEISKKLGVSVKKVDNTIQKFKKIITDFANFIVYAVNIANI